MTTTSDMKYGRQGGRFVAPDPAVTSCTVKPWPTAAKLRRHLEIDHAMPVAVLDAHTQAEHRIWHQAEHATRDPDQGKARHAGHLDHSHPREPS